MNFCNGATMQDAAGLALAEKRCAAVASSKVRGFTAITIVEKIVEKTLDNETIFSLSLFRIILNKDNGHLSSSRNSH